MELPKRICIFHSIDLDGWASAAIVKHKFPSTILIGYNYGQPIPLIPRDSHVIICDVAFPMEEMYAISERSASFTWIDHHFSNINNYHDFLATRRGYLDWRCGLPNKNEMIGACELTWRYYYPDFPLPRAIELLGAYDCFRHKGTDDEMPAIYFQLAAQAKVFDPISADIFIGMSDIQLGSMLDQGKVIYEYKRTMAQETYRNAFPVTIFGKKFIMANADRFNPINYEIDYIADGYDGSGCFWFDGFVWHMSLYTVKPDMDCSAICKKFGGGGHKGAAGCEPPISLLLNIFSGEFDEDLE